MIIQNLKIWIPRPCNPFYLVNWRQSQRHSLQASFKMDVSEVQQKEIKTSIQEVVGAMNTNSTHLIEKATRSLCGLYFELEPNEKLFFLNILAKDYNVDHSMVENFAKNFLDSVKNGTSTDMCSVLKTEEKLRNSLTPKYSKLFSQIGKLEGGVKFLVNLRTDLLNFLESTDGSRPDSTTLQVLNHSLRDMLTLWFSVGFLNLERVTWESSCDMLQKVSDYEAVHPIRNWTDLKRRVGLYRRCFVFTHNSMPREPIVVLHTALTNSIPQTIQTIVAHQRMHSEADILGNAATIGEDSDRITAAIFYSITSSQKGLQGIELGNYLIKKVVKELQAEFPKIQMFSSLSPIPGFTSWITVELTRVERSNKDAKTIFTNDELKSLTEILEDNEFNSLIKLKKLVGTNGWIQNEKLTELLEKPFMRLCSRYLYLEKRRAFALDNVANFHLKNGATMWRLNWKADLSPRGLGSSCGIMVNYRYFLDELEQNSAQYLENQTIKATEQILHLARQSWEVAKEVNASL